jgi:6-phosphogluconolactonase
MVPNQIVNVLNDDEIADFVVLRWEEISREAIDAAGFFAAAVSGGKTPIPIYRRLADRKDSLPWQQTHIFLVDERFVPPHHPDSNFRMVEETLLSRVPLPLENIHPIPTEPATPYLAAQKYEEDLRRFFGASPGNFPRFDLILLGIGEDGHTASLFPGRLPLKDSKQLAAAITLDETRHSRITLTLPVINQAKNILFLVTGEDKAVIAGRVIQEGDAALPASLVRPQTGSLMFLLDRGASSRLSAGPQPEARKAGKEKS